MQTFLHEKYQNQAWSDDAEQILRTCVHCGFCTAVCPTYQLSGEEAEGPRGRIYLIHSFLHNNEITQDTQQHLDSCLTCRSCEAMCPSGVKYARLLEIGRTEIDKQVKRNFFETFQRKSLVHILPYQNRTKWLIDMTSLVPSYLLPKHIKTHLPTQKPIAYSVKVKKHERKVLLLDGCAQSVLAPNINQATEKLLNALNISVVKASDAGCCGALAYHLTEQKIGLDHAKKLIDKWMPLIDGVEAIVMTASGCGSFIKEYGEIFKHDPEYLEKAEKIASLTRDLVEVIAPDDLMKLKPDTDLKTKVAAQIPCTLQHGQKLTNRLEPLLEAFGFELTTVENGHLCCGSAGTYSILQPKKSQQLKANKLQALQANQPEVIVTANIGCLTHLQHDADVPVKHWAELVAERLAD
ncbi:glycolate oxidase subunit GlcF [Candidatus Albibeggiatoa sp. nov. NOAA]|uniref:glycolate oxidase subunit GlcF n=1 Tax=Candidatus Albibeggiatoa sp. nov. NOAA TaxID=3162724 RepID=UPI0032F68F46|nr:glycolate oxidase subunit GlcF [Thiotrichaceae bacterium]